MSQPRNATTTNRGRTYRWRDEDFVSVTTIINGGVPKPALKAWGERRVAETAVDKLLNWEGMERDEAVDWLKRAPFREMDKAAVQGSDIHDWCERFVLHDERPQVDDAPEAQRPYLMGFLSYVNEWHPRYEMTEASVYNRQWGFAGTLDAIVTIDGLGRGLIDYKTSRGIYGEVALQLAAYRAAEFVGLADGTEAPMPAVDWCGVLHLTPEGYQLVPVEAGEDEFRSFLYCQQVRSFIETRSRQVLGAPLVAPCYQHPPREKYPTNTAALVSEA